MSTWLREPTPINECENDYAVSALVGEFYCAFTSLCVALVTALVGIQAKSSRSRWLSRAACFTALSSVLYHVNLTRATLFLDQFSLAMLGAVMLGQPFLGALGLVAPPFSQE